MKANTSGIVLVAFGIIMMIYTGFNYVTTEKVVDLGLVQINSRKNHPIQWSPIIGAGLLVVGVAIIVRGRKSI